MSVQFSIPTEILPRWLQKSPHLPAHLPRLVLADRYHPHYVRRCQTTQQLLPLLRLVDWEQLPATLTWRSRGECTVPLAAYIGAYLLKLERNLPTFGALRHFLCEHPALVWALGFPLVMKPGAFGKLDADASLPSHDHFPRKLAQIPNEVLQSLLDAQVAKLTSHFGATFGSVIAIDTKHIIAWVKENNPKAYSDKDENEFRQQPAGDKDCKLGCKRKRNQLTPANR